MHETFNTWSLHDTMQLLPNEHTCKLVEQCFSQWERHQQAVSRFHTLKEHRHLDRSYTQEPGYDLVLLSRRTSFKVDGDQAIGHLYTPGTTDRW